MAQLENILVDVRILADAARKDSERRNYTTYPDYIQEFNRLLSAVEQAGLETNLEPIRPVPSDQLAAFGSVGMGTNAEIAKIREVANKSSRLLARVVPYQEARQAEVGKYSISVTQQLQAASKKPAALMSYAHRDDDDGRLTKLRERLAHEVSVRTGADFKIFQDRPDIQWGQDWKQQIEASLDEVTFLIAIVTPSFLNSTNCRDELQRFLDREKKLGRNDLVLPIYYIDSPLMNDAGRRKQDELAQALNTHQYADWRQLRGMSWSSPKVRKGLDWLAIQLFDALERVQDMGTLGTGDEVQLSEPLQEGDQLKAQGNVSSPGPVEVDPTEVPRVEPVSQPGAEDLKHRSRGLSEELSRFLDERLQEDPQHTMLPRLGTRDTGPDSQGHLNEVTQAMIRYDSETMRIYRQRDFPGKVRALREDLKARGWWNPDEQDKEKLEDPVHWRDIQFIAEYLSSIEHRAGNEASRVEVESPGEKRGNEGDWSHSEDLKRRCRELAEEIRQFLEDCESKGLDEDQIMNLYRRRLGDKANALLEELEENDQYPPKKLKSYEISANAYPRSLMAINRLANTLGTIGHRK